MNQMGKDHALYTIARFYLRKEMWRNMDYIKKFLESWNPIENDADLFRLMIDAKISITYEGGYVTAGTEIETLNHQGRHLGNWPHVAARQAIISMALAIAEGME